MKLILLGPPGAGKGTQAAYIEKKYALIQISTGDMFRSAVASGSDLGKKAKKIMDAGELVPDDLVLSMIRERIVLSDCANGFILDGFPRTLAQAEALDALLLDMDSSLDLVVQIDANDSVLIERVSGRFTCAECGAGYNHITNPPLIKGVCDVCSSESFTQRDDDNATTVKARLEAYHQQTKPLIPYYKEKGLLNVVDGLQEISKVQCDIDKIVSKALTSE